MIKIDARTKSGDHPLSGNEHAGIERYRSASGERGVRAAQAMDFGTFIDENGDETPLSATDYIVTAADGGNVRKFSAGEFEQMFIPE